MLLQGQRTRLTLSAPSQKETSLAVISSVQTMGRFGSWSDNCVYVGMPGPAARSYGIPDASVGPFGKPWHLKQDPRGWAPAYVEYLCTRLTRDAKFEASVRALHGRTLLCWCTAKAESRGHEVACHARILSEFIEMLNGCDEDA